MQNHNEEEEYEEWRAKGSFCWWRSAAKFEECLKLNLLEIPNLSNITPKVKILREMERLALVAHEGLDELRHKLFAYHAGDFWIPTGGMEKEEMDTPPVITILLVGFHNAGKSSLVNLMYSVLGRCGLIPFAQTSSGNTSNFTTMFMREHNVLRSPRSGFCVYDTRGFDYDRVDESIQEMSAWMNVGVHHNQLCLRSGDKNVPGEDEIPLLRSSLKFARRRVNCVMVVANVAEIYKSLKVEDKEPLESLRQLFCSQAIRKCNETPILILTHGDKLSTEDRIDARLKVCEHLGISETNGSYDIICLTEYGFPADEVDPVTAYALTEAVYRALLISDRTHLPLTRFQDRILQAFYWFCCSVGALFTVLAHFFSKMGGRG